MTTNAAIEGSGLLVGEGWRDRIEAGVRGRICGFLEALQEAELLAEEDVVRLILDGRVVCVQFDLKTTSISLPVVLAIRRDEQKVLRDVPGREKRGGLAHATR
jgi:hypothetical protein